MPGFIWITCRENEGSTGNGLQSFLVRKITVYFSKKIVYDALFYRGLQIEYSVIFLPRKGAIMLNKKPLRLGNITEPAVRRLPGKGKKSPGCSGRDLYKNYRMILSHHHFSGLYLFTAIIPQYHKIYPGTITAQIYFL